MPYYKFPTDLLNGRGEVIDPWGNPYVYQNNQSDWSEGKLSETARRTLSFNIHSFGPDGVDNKGSGDDLGN